MSVDESLLALLTAIFVWFRYFQTIVFQDKCKKNYICHIQLFNPKKMKGLLTLTTLCFVLLLSSCADESLVPGPSGQTKTPEPASIVGKWQLQALGMITNVKSYETTLDEINTAAKTNTQVAKMTQYRCYLRI